MLSKLLSLLSTAKGAAAATVIGAAAVSGGVVATNTDVQDTVGNVVQAVTAQSSRSPEIEAKGPQGSGQPAVVAARNDADKKLRAAAQEDQRKLEKLRSTKVEGADHGKLEDLVKTADQKLRARLTSALDAVAALTLGRDGREDRDDGKDRASASPKPSASPTPKPSASPDVKAVFSADAQAKVDAIVKAAIADMATIVSDAEKAVAALPSASPKHEEAGKPQEQKKDDGKRSEEPRKSGEPARSSERPAQPSPSASPRG